MSLVERLPMCSLLLGFFLALNGVQHSGWSSQNQAKSSLEQQKNALATELSDYISTPIKKASHTAILRRVLSVLLIEQSLQGGLGAGGT